MMLSEEHAWYSMIRTGDWRNRTPGVRQDEYIYNITIITIPEIRSKTR